MPADDFVVRVQCNDVPVGLLCRGRLRDAVSIDLRWRRHVSRRVPFDNDRQLFRRCLQLWDGIWPEPPMYRGRTVRERRLPLIGERALTVQIC